MRYDAGHLGGEQPKHQAPGEKRQVGGMGQEGGGASE